MTLTATRFTPEVLLSAPRRSAGQPNSSGTHALFTVTTYSFEKHEKTSQVRLLDIDTGRTSVLYEGSKYREPAWLTDSSFLLLEDASEGRTNLLLSGISPPTPTKLAVIPASVSDVKVRALPDGSFAFACSAPTTRDGRLANPARGPPPPPSTARTYTSLYARHWDAWCGDSVPSIWYGSLLPSPASASAPYALLPASGLVNALAGTGLVSPVPQLGGADDFDLGPAGHLAFVASDPSLSPANYTKTDLYLLDLPDGFAAPRRGPPRRVPTPGLRGYSEGPVFSARGDRLAFTRMRDPVYESDRPRLLVAPVGGGDARELSPAAAAWDAKPGGLVWGAGDAELFVRAEERGRAKVWRVGADGAAPVALTAEGSVSAVSAIAGGRLFVSGSSLVDSSWYGVLDPATAELRVVSSATHHGRALGLGRKQLGEIWFRGAGDYDVHALVVRPSGFEEGKRYPLALLVHGGPQGAWLDAWSTRWNPAAVAEQGYVVVCPNPTGSSGYGMALQDGIQGQWGGRPYEDLVNCFEYLRDNVPYVDTERAVALGASYGGYMINWIQGKPLGRKFKALVCHDGVFSTLNMWSTEELFFPIREFEGNLWENRAGYEKWDPSRFTQNWATPQLVIHSELDYRLPVTEGLAAFNVLQTRGVPSKLLVYPDENHWVLNPENSLVWHREVFGWINKYSGVEDAEDTSKATLGSS